MGLAQSSESRSESSENHHKNKLKSYKRTMSKHRTRVEATKGSYRSASKWKFYLVNLLSSEPATPIANWDHFKEGLLKFIEEDHENNISWIADLQSTSLGFRTYQSQLSAREEAPVVDFTKYDNEEMVATEIENETLPVPKTAHRTASKYENSPALSQFAPRNPNNASFLNYSPEESVISRPRFDFVSPKSMAASRFMSMVQNERSIKQDFKTNLGRQLKNGTHIIFRLIREFHRIFDNQFTSLHKNLDLEDIITEKDEATVNAIPLLIKHFANILRDFTGWLYKDLISQLAYGLDQEDVHPELVIENIIYEILLGSSNLMVNKLAYLIIKLKNKANLEKIKRVMLKMQNEDLKNYDECLLNSIFLLNNSQKPYERAIRRVLEMKNKADPYAKFDLVLSLEEDLLATLGEYYQDDPATIQKIRNQFSMDIKIPVIIYCIVKSQNENVLVDRLFIDEYIQPEYLEITPAFSAFSSCIDYLLLEVEKDQ